MVKCNIKIFSKEQMDSLAAENKTAFDGKVSLVSEVTDMLLIEKGTDKGNTSASLFIPLPSNPGVHLVVNMTAAQLVSLASAALGAASRFGEVISAPGAFNQESSKRP